MKIYWKGIVPLGNEVVASRIKNDVQSALSSIRTRGSDFIVNDSNWYWRNPTGKVRPTVVNSAKFITGNFQRHLERNRGWQIEKCLCGQRVDAYSEFEGVFEIYTLREEDFLPLLHAYERLHKRSSGPIATQLYVQHLQKQTPALSDDLRPLHKYFSRISRTVSLRVGVEFETGNVASSFRAANKLEQLYQLGELDLGVFITSIDKPSCAARIWPISNRNGSFQELERRSFAKGLAIPLWHVGFAPDGFDCTVGYLSDDGSLYQMRKTERHLIAEGTRFEIWHDVKGQERLLPVNHPST